jgi:hypothetical protein
LPFDILGVIEGASESACAESCAAFSSGYRRSPTGVLGQMPDKGDDGAKSLLSNALFVGCEDIQLLDIDTRQDLLAARARLSRVNSDPGQTTRRKSSSAD